MVSAEERALARAALYRLLAAAFSYPGDSLTSALETARVAAPLLGLERPVAEVVAAFAAFAEGGELEAAYQRAFTLSYSEDCPMYETAFSARHLFQQTRQLADLAGFYAAFGVAARADRPDHVGMELEFCYLLAVKEAAARARGEREQAAVCREAARAFVGDHLGRWAPLFAGRAEIAAAGTPYAAAARLLAAFLATEERYLRVGEVARYRDEPAVPLDEPGEMECPLAGGAVESMMDRLAELGEERDHGTVPVG